MHYVRHAVLCDRHFPPRPFPCNIRLTQFPSPPTVISLLVISTPSVFPLVFIPPEFSTPNFLPLAIPPSPALYPLSFSSIGLFVIKYFPPIHFYPGFFQFGILYPGLFSRDFFLLGVSYRGLFSPGLFVSGHFHYRQCINSALCQNI